MDKNMNEFAEWLNRMSDLTMAQYTRLCGDRWGRELAMEYLGMAVAYSQAADELQKVSTLVSTH